MPASAIRKLIPLSDAAKKQGVKVYHLNMGQPDSKINSPECALDAVRNFKGTNVSYSNSAGLMELREGLVEKYYRKIGIDIEVPELLVTVAGSESVLMSLEITCDEGDEVIVVEPFYTNYNTFAFMNGITLKAVPTDIRNGFQLPDMAEFEKAITDRTKAILICNPGNPTGTLYSKESMTALGEIVKKHDLFLISDEVYREFCYTDEPHYSCMHLEGLEDNVILLDSVSKRYSLCGVRVGALVSRNREVIKSVMKYAQARLCSPAYGQIAAEAALSAPASYFKAVREEYIKRRDFLVDTLNTIPGVKCPRPMGAFYAAVELPIDDSDKFAQWLLEDFSVDGKTVMVAPMAGFYATPGKGRNEVRIAYVLKIEDLKEALACLKKALEVYPGRTGR